jgi:hypothetical protein
MYSKTQIYSKYNLNNLNYYEGLLNYVISLYNLNLKIFILKNKIFQQKCEKCEVIEILTSNHMHMEDDKHN